MEPLTNGKQPEDEKQRQLNHDVWGKITGVIQLEYNNGSWLAHVDAKKVEELTGFVVEPVMSKEAGIELFNSMSTELGAKSLKQPVGYMMLDDNVSSYLKQAYQDTYENTLQAIDNHLVDGSGYGVRKVLDTLASTMRKDVSAFLPPDMNYSDLRFMPINSEQKEAIDMFVKNRVSITLTYEKKRSYEAETQEQVVNSFNLAGKNLKETLSPTDEPKQSKFEFGDMFNIDIPEDGPQL